MNMLPDISKIVSLQKSYFQCGFTGKIKFRQTALDKLFKAVKEFEPEIFAALHTDLGKSDFEAFATEVGMVLDDIAYMRRNVAKLSSRKSVSISKNNFPAKGYIYPEPYGSVLIFSAWNYPFQLMLGPLAAAIAAGNCVVLKPSEHAPATAAVITKIIAGLFEPQHIAVINGDADTGRKLLAEKFDYIFYTGSSAVGRMVMHAAAENLTPVTLELGGKSPCVVDADACLELAAKRIVWGKFLNAGQTCVAPDYLYVHSSVKTALLEKMRHYIREFYGENPAASPDYPRIVNERHFNRLAALMNRGNIVCGGEKDLGKRYIAPTIIDGITKDDPVMREEIFGPILPVMEFKEIHEVVDFINSRPKPLALYYFSRNKLNKKLLVSRTSSGGMCVNETVTHLINSSMPFGGVGESGMGAYHGKAGFDTFTHYKPVMSKSNLFDIPLRYPPYTGWKMKLLRLLSK
jgi:aldehyde dehydrogenase (NAD+)